jgi:hypothetical protein
MAFLSMRIVLVAACLFLPRAAFAQRDPTGDRSASILAGVIDMDDGVPLLMSRYRFQTAMYGAAEFGVGVGRQSIYPCAMIVTPASARCETEHPALFVGSLTYGASVPVGRMRPFALFGVGALASTAGDALAFGLGSIGMAVQIRAPFAARVEAGRRYVHSEGWFTHYLVGFEVDLAGT